MSVNQRKGINPLLRWLWDLLSYFSGDEIKVAPEFNQKVLDIKTVLESDVSGIVNSILDFGINAATVDLTIETDNENLTKVIQEWFKRINFQLVGKIPTGLKPFSKEYYRERWKNSSLIVLRTIWENIDIEGVTLNMPTKMWFIDGQNIVVEDPNNENRIIGAEKYYLRISEDKKISLPSQKEELVFVQKPFSSWSLIYPTPYLIQRGIWKNLKIYELINKKSERLVAKALEYMLMMKKGTENLALKGSSDFTYSEEELKTTKEDFKKWQLENRQEPGTPTYLTNFDTEVQEIIPDYEKVLKESLYSNIQKRLLAGLGMIEIVDGTTSTRREGILNPRPFITEVESGIKDFINLISDVMLTIVERNKDSHPKFFGSKIQLHYNPIRDFLMDNSRDHMRSMYDRGLISKQTYSEVVGGFDIDIEQLRRVDENKPEKTKIFMPPVITSIPENPNEVKSVLPAKKPNDKIPPSKTGPEKKNFKGSEEEEIDEDQCELGTIVKRKDGYYVLSEKTGKSLGGPYKTRKQALKRLRQVEFFKHQGMIEDEIAIQKEEEEE